MKAIPLPTAILMIAGLATIVGVISDQTRKTTAPKSPAVRPIDRINPADRRNVIYESVNKAGGWLFSEPDFSLGSKIYDWLHPDEDKALAGQLKDVRGVGGAKQTGNGKVFYLT